MNENDKIKCLNCGTINRSDAKFCVHCGVSLEDAKDDNLREYRVNNNFHKKHDRFLWIAIVVVAVLVIIGGVFAWKVYKQPTVTSHSTNTQNATQTTYFDQLSKSDKKKVHFKFTISQDETKDNTADMVYTVSMKVKNETNTTIKFHESKFVYILDEDKILSSTKGTLAVKSGKSATIDQLFENVPEQGTVGDGFIEYLNSNNKLAYADFENNNTATSDNLTNKKLIKWNKDITGDSSYSTQDSDDSSYSYSNTQDSDASSGNNSAESSSSSMDTSNTQATYNTGSIPEVTDTNTAIEASQIRFAKWWGNLNAPKNGCYYEDLKFVWGGDHSKFIDPNGLTYIENNNDGSVQISK